MSMYTRLRKSWNKKENKTLMKERKIKWRKEGAFEKIQKPTRLDRARRIGYKSKKGFVLVRARVGKAGRKKPKFHSGRRPKRYGRVRFTAKKSAQRIAEERTARKFPNLEVLNSYWVGEDGNHKWFEIILVDPNSPEIKKDKDLNWICQKNQKSRTFRGLTSSGKKSRGLRK